MIFFKIIWSAWPLLLLLVIIGAGKLLFQIFSKKPDQKSDLSAYEKKPYLFDNVSEFNLYKILLELFGDTYYIFPQINYSHLIKPKKTTWLEERKNRNRIDRKSADFILCDKERVVPQLIIELDGSIHNSPRKQKRDDFINDLAESVGLRILHLKSESLDREFIRGEINDKLVKK